MLLSYCSVIATGLGINEILLKRPSILVLLTNNNNNLILIIMIIEE